MFKAIIFDFDGVIFDSEPFQFQVCSHIAAQFSFPLLYNDYLKDYAGLSDKMIFEKILTQSRHSFTQTSISDLIRQKIVLYRELLEQQKEIFGIEHVLNFVRFCHEKKISLGICSGSPREEIELTLSKINQGKFRSYFSSIVCADDLTKGKPSPEGYLRVSQQLAINPNECLVIEDTPRGIEAGKAAGMYVVGLLTTFKEEALKEADHITTTCHSLITLVS